jgi:hypothetical protein
LKFTDRHKFLTAARAEAAVFWEGLVLNDHGRDTRRRVAWRDIGDVHGIAESCIDVGDDRSILHLANRAHDLQVDVHREDAGVWHSVGRGKFEAATPYRIETSTGGELGRERVVLPSPLPAGGRRFWSEALPPLLSATVPVVWTASGEEQAKGR